MTRDHGAVPLGGHDGGRRLLPARHHRSGAAGDAPRSAQPAHPSGDQDPVDARAQGVSPRELEGCIGFGVVCGT